MTGKGALGGGIIALTVVMGVIYFIHAIKTEAKAEKRGMANPTQCRNEDSDWVTIPAGSYKDHAGDCIAGTPPPPPPPTIVAPAERPWTTRTFNVPATGLRLWLEPGSARYPKLGGVLTHTSSGKSYVDLPGVDHDGENNPPGWFTFLPDPPGSVRRIEIYNRW